jgi:D-arabinose 1-dehydrogenase-like Zn-dependent alcohol dehydrogenase
MRVVQVSRPNGRFDIAERQIPEPGTGSIRIRVQACGICHSDSVTKEGHYPGIQYPRVPGHEVAGVIDAVGPGTVGWQPGQRVGVGWNGGYCGRCDPILGLGGLGHLGFQYAAKMGFHTVGIARLC